MQGDDDMQAQPGDGCRTYVVVCNSPPSTPALPASSVAGRPRWRGCRRMALGSGCLAANPLGTMMRAAGAIDFICLWELASLT
jgi:hypothetical protein